MYNTFYHFFIIHILQSIIHRKNFKYIVTFAAIIKYKLDITNMKNILSRMPHSIYRIFMRSEFLNIVHLVKTIWRKIKYGITPRKIEGILNLHRYKLH